MAEVIMHSALPGTPQPPLCRVTGQEQAVIGNAELLPKVSEQLVRFYRVVGVPLPDGEGVARAAKEVHPFWAEYEEGEDRIIQIGIYHPQVPVHSPGRIGE